MAEGTIEQVVAGDARWCVINANCLDVLPTLDACSVDHVLTDPPYSKHTHENMRGNRGDAGIVTRDPGFGYLKASERRALCRELCRVARGWLLIFSDWESIAWWRISLNASGGDYRRPIPWVRWSSPQFNAQAAPSASEAVVTAKPIARGRMWLGGERVMYEAKCLRSSNKVAGHETEKPEPLILQMLSDVAIADDLVLDCYMGSCTTGAAALKRGMRFIGIEKNPAWIGLARERLRAVESESTLAARLSGQTSLFERSA